MHNTRPPLTDFGAINDALSGTRAPSARLTEEALVGKLLESVRGQDRCIRSMASWAVRHLARIEPRRPLSMFGLGRTGTGKTKSAQALAKALTELSPKGDGYGFIRFDMAEFQEKHRLSSLIGSPPGYIGYDEGAPLPDALTANERTIVLFDEIEKAHPDVLRCLLGALDEGRLSRHNSKSQGKREVSCRKAIFLFTSNIACDAVVDELKARGDDGIDPGVVDEVARNHVRVAGIAPELVGRMTSFLFFEDLPPQVMAEIVALAIVDVGREFGIDVARIDPNVVLKILGETRAKNLGARPYEHQILQVLGGAFISAQRAGLRGRVTVIEGPPYACVPCSAI
jgi:ATP-dependent Clp protease ATP-binding subunit ClpA